jgi:hypothetical protein
MTMTEHLSMPTKHPNDSRYLLCLGVCNTLLDVPTIFTDPQLEALAMWQSQNPDPVATIRHAMDVAPTLANAIPLGGKFVFLKRPHLQDLVDYIQRQPDLDVAIITSATREFVDLVMGKAAPQLLALCKFVWTREDSEKFLRRAGGEYYKTLQHIPELMGYQLGRILMMEHNRVHPPELHLRIPAYVFYPECPELQAQDNGIPEIIRRLDILLQVDDILALRREEHAQYMQLAQLRSDWITEQGISLFDSDYRQRMQLCPVPPFRAIDD